MGYLHESLSARTHQYLQGIIIVLLYDTDCIWINWNLFQFLASQSKGDLTPLFPSEMWKSYFPLGIVISVETVKRDFAEYFFMKGETNI